MTNIVTPQSPKCPLLGKITSGRINGQANIVIPDCMRQQCRLWNEVLERCGLMANTFTLEQTRRLDVLERKMNEHTHE